MGELRRSSQWGGADHSEEEENLPMAELLEGLAAFPPIRQGDVIEGTVLRATSGEVLIDIGSKSEGVIANRELSQMTREELAEIKVGQEVLVYVLTTENREGAAVLSLRRAQLEKDWQRVEFLHEQGDNFEAEITDHNKGGLIAHIGRVRGFVPSSQLEIWKRPAGEGETREDRLASIVGQKLHLKVIEIDRRRNRLILSERAATREWRRSQRERLLEELGKGDVRVGEVSGLAEFGAFVDLGGADGLIHISELSWRRVSHPSEVVKVGDEVEVYVLGVDRERQRISLSLKRLETEPWEKIGKEYQEGQLIQGTITKLTDFGAFASLDDGVEGLIHISELSERHVSHPREVVGEGDLVTLRILRIDTERQRIALSLKRVEEGMDYVEYEPEEPSEVGTEEGVATWEEEKVDL